MFLKPCFLGLRSPTFLAPGTDFVEDSFSADPGRGGGAWFGEDSSTLHFLSTLLLLLLHQLHLSSSGVRSWRLGTPVLLHSFIRSTRTSCPSATLDIPTGKSPHGAGAWWEQGVSCPASMCTVEFRGAAF